jgi:hypothetical protein
MSVPFRPSDPPGRRVPTTADPPDVTPQRCPPGPEPSAMADDEESEGEDVPAEALDDPPADAQGPPRSSRPRRSSRGRRLAPASEAPAPGLTAEQRLLLLDAWRRSGLPAGDFAPPRQPLQAHPLRLETPLPGRGAGRTARQAARLASRQPFAGGHQTRHLDDEAGQPRLGMRADQRLADARPRLTRQPPGRRPRPARSRL